MRFLVRICAALVLAALVTLSISERQLPSLVGVVYLVMGVASIVACWLDKAAAEGGRWRIPESRLHGIDVLGGVIGGLFAQALLRHKTSKSSFALMTGAIVLLHAAMLSAALFGYLAPLTA